MDMKTTPIKIKIAKKRIRRPRRELPEDLSDLFIADGDRPSDLDVIAGRGGGSNHHEGNKRYWRRILAERPGYKQLGKNDNTSKNEISEGIYMYILSTGGRFLQLDTRTEKWFMIPKKISLDKIKQALRDKYVPHFLKGETIPPMAERLQASSAPTVANTSSHQATAHAAPQSKRKIGLLLAAGAICLAEKGSVCNAYQTNINYGLTVPRRRGIPITKSWISGTTRHVDSMQAWGTFEPAIRLVYKIQPEVPSFVLSLAYYIIATIPLCILAWRETPPDLENVETESEIKSNFSQLWGGLELGTYLFVGNALQVIGLRTVPSDRAAFLLQLTTIFVPLVQSILARNLLLIPAKTWVACCVALAGVALIGVENADGDVSFASFSLDLLQFSAGDQCIMLAAFVYTFHCIRLEKYAKEIPSAIRLAAAKASTETGWSALAVGAGLIAAAQTGTLENPVLGGLQTSGRGILEYTETFLDFLDSMQDVDISQYVTLAGSLSWIGLVTVAYTISAQTYGQSRVPPSTANLIYTLQPIFTALLAYLLLGETLSYTGLAGGTLIGSAVLLVVAEVGNGEPGGVSRSIDSTKL
ncbi:unnamed protein product [Cylindrotheca closterium]|uniref:EamA domain-containing protein n=1 Tax=Cylindrotheca closterium TaxID=2856 RepID=A0AAD2FCE2_9STRA|nr:unnamed protein product [Cylindrotheca closterium]